MDVPKIDRSFGGGSGRDVKGGKDLVCAAIDLARAPGLDVVAEVIQTSEQAGELARPGCEAAHGYYFARPLAARPYLLWIL